MQQQTKNKAALTIAATAKEYGLPEYCIRQLVKRGEFPVIQTGNRCYILRQVFEDYLATGGGKYKPA